jgi:hypothetical protein
MVNSTKSDGTDGVTFSFTGPTSPTYFAYTVVQVKRNKTDFFGYGDNTYDAANFVGNEAPFGSSVAVIEGIIRNGSNAGTLILRADAEVVNTITILGTLSTLKVW